jgi:hypothetical protein
VRKSLKVYGVSTLFYSPYIFGRDFGNGDF